MRTGRRYKFLKIYYFMLFYILSYVLVFHLSFFNIWHMKIGTMDEWGTFTDEFYVILCHEYYHEWVSSSWKPLTFHRWSFSLNKVRDVLGDRGSSGGNPFKNSTRLTNDKRESKVDVQSRVWQLAVVGWRVWGQKPAAEDLFALNLLFWHQWTSARDNELIRMIT